MKKALKVILYRSISKYQKEKYKHIAIFNGISRDNRNIPRHITMNLTKLMLIIQRCLRHFSELELYQNTRKRIFNRLVILVEKGQNK